jgi:hypothetical protein
MRQCKICKQTKELNSENFPNRPLKKAPPFRWECRSCYNENKRNMPLYWAHKMLSGARRRSLDRGWPPCTLTAQDIWDVWPVDFKCPVLGIKLVHGHEDRYNSPTLERINNDELYIKGNILIVSSRANCIKNDGTWQEIMQVAKFYKQLEESKNA